MNAVNQVRKFLIAAVGVIGTALSAGLLTGDVKTVATVIIAVATALGVYVVPNSPAAS